MRFRYINELPLNEFTFQIAFNDTQFNQEIHATAIRYAVLCDSSNLVLVNDSPFTATVTDTNGTRTETSIEKTVDTNPYIYMYHDYINGMLQTDVDEDKAKTFFNDSPYYVVSIGNGLPLGDAPNEIVSSGAYLFTIQPEALTTSGMTFGDGYLSRINENYRWNGVDYGLEFLIVGSADIRMKDKIRHTIYLDGNGDTKTVWIKTEHNIASGYVETEDRLGVCTGGGTLPVGIHEPDFKHFVTTAYDRPSLKSYTWNTLYNNALNEANVPKMLSFMYPDLWIQFEDNIWHSQTKESYKSVSVQLAKDNSYHYWQLPAPEQNDYVEVIVIVGSPSDEDKENSSDGEAGDNRNYDGSNRYKDDKGDNPDNYQRGSDEGSVGIFNDAYLVTNENMILLREKLWTQSYFNVLKVNENPMDNILSVKRFCFQMDSGTAKDIVVGNINTEVQGKPLSKGIYEKDFTLSNKVAGCYGNFVDLKMKMSLFLPFIGYVPLETSNFLYQNLKVKYLVDIMNGACKAIIYRNGQPVLEHDGIMGIDLNLSASTQKQSDIAFYSRIASGGIGVGMGLATGNPLSILGGLETIANTDVKNSFQSTTAGGSISNAGYLEVFLVRIAPELTVTTGFYPEGYKHSYGVPNMSTTTIGSLKGYVKVGGHINLNNFKATNEEKAEIEDLLTKGVVING